mgnify:CR=1 FL=1
MYFSFNSSLTDPFLTALIFFVIIVSINFLCCDRRVVMRPVMSANACVFDNSYDGVLNNKLALSIEPYDSVATRFNCILKKGDTLLVQLMLKQATQTKSKKVMSEMLNALVHHAVSSPNN